MTDTKKTKSFVSLWVKEDKNGNVFLSGKDRATSIRWFVFTDKEGQRVLKKAEDGGGIVDVGILTAGTNDRGEYWHVNSMFVAENNFYDAADPFLKYKTGEYVLNKEGEKIGAPEYQIAIPLEA